MPRVAVTLEEQNSDHRDNEAAFRFRIDNHSATPIEVRRLSPRFPDGVVLIEVRDSSVEAARAKHNKLTAELTTLLNGHIFATSAAFRASRVEQEREFVKEIFKDAHAIFRVYFQMATGRMEKRLEERRELRASQRLIIANAADAKVAEEQWFVVAENSNPVSQIFRAKSKQLEAVTASLARGAESAALATIEPDSFYATTYVLRFPRRFLNPSKFTFTVEAALAEPDSPRETLTSGTTTVDITARPYLLSLTSIVFAVLGVTVRFSVEHASKLPLADFFAQLGHVLATGSGISAVVLSVVIFNTELLRVSWTQG